VGALRGNRAQAGDWVAFEGGAQRPLTVATTENAAGLSTGGAPDELDKLVTHNWPSCGRSNACT